MSGDTRFDRLLYAQCWEDHRLPEGALKARAPGGHFLSVCSGGCNSLALLLREPERVVAIDFSEAQLNVTRLKIAAIRKLDYADYLALQGLHPEGGPVSGAVAGRALDALLPMLDGQTRAFFERAHNRALITGPTALLGAGRFERYLGLFRERVLPLVHRRRTVRALLETRGHASRRAFYDRRWDTLRWRGLFRLFFSQAVMSRLGRDPSFFAHVEEGAIGDVFLGRARRALRELPVHENPYVEFILTGSYANPQAVQPHLSLAGYEKLRAGLLDHLDLVHGELGAWLQAAPGRSIDGFNLSDVFEWLDPTRTEALLREVARIGRHEARVCYFNLLVPRQRPESLAAQLRPLEGLAAQLHARDRSFVWGNFVVEEVA